MDHQRIIDRLEILSAPEAALDRRREVFTAIEDSTIVGDAKNSIVGLLGVSEVGADAVLALQLRRFTRDERGKIADEATGLRAHLGGLGAQLARRQEVE